MTLTPEWGIIVMKGKGVISRTLPRESEREEALGRCVTPKGFSVTYAIVFQELALPSFQSYYM